MPASKIKTVPTPVGKDDLTLNLSGRLIEHLGLQMYQSPVAAVAELIANAWDADAHNVFVRLPEDVSEKDAKLEVEDDGNGMTYEQVQDLFLVAGRDKRAGKAYAETEDHRTVLGRKGIGKFAGFGIAKVIRVRTTSAETGEVTEFVMDYDKIRGEGHAYVMGEGIEMDLTDYLAPDPARIDDHGTRVTLERLILKTNRKAESFAKSMARRFLLLQGAADFNVFINALEMPDDIDLSDVNYDFPKDFHLEEIPEGTKIEQGWGVLMVPGAGRVKWRARFTKDPITKKIEDIKGIAVFASGKMVQSPFFFDLEGGVTNQVGLEYLTGSVQADFIDQLDVDVIAPERQRVNWDHDQTKQLREWGEKLVRKLLRAYDARRTEAKTAIIEEKFSPLYDRLHGLPTHERKTVSRALRQIARIDEIDAGKFSEISNALLTAWESNRLRELITTIGDADHLDGQGIIALIGEAEVLSALSVAEVVKLKGSVIAQLRDRIDRGELEGPVREHIVAHPWMLDPRWERFKHAPDLSDAAKAISDKRRGPSDSLGVVLIGGEDVLVVELVRPGLEVDYDALEAFQKYANFLTEEITAKIPNVRSIEFLMVADGFDSGVAIGRLRETLQSPPNPTHTIDWRTLLKNAEERWGEFLAVLQSRNPDDARIQSLGIV